MNNTIDIEIEGVIQSQDAQLAAFILAGNKWHGKMDQRRYFEIGNSNSRIYDLYDKYGLRKYFFQKKIWYKSKNKNGNNSRCRIYYIPLENIPEAIEHLIVNHPKFYKNIMHYMHL